MERGLQDGYVYHVINRGNGLGTGYMQAVGTGEYDEEKRRPRKAG